MTRYCAILGCKTGTPGGGIAFVHAHNEECARAQVEVHLKPPFIHADGWHISKLFVPVAPKELIKGEGQ